MTSKREWKRRAKAAEGVVRGATASMPGWSFEFQSDPEHPWPVDVMRAERDRARDCAAALEAENARLLAGLREIRNDHARSVAGLLGEADYEVEQPSDHDGFRLGDTVEFDSAGEVKRGYISDWSDDSDHAIVVVGGEYALHTNRLTRVGP